MNPLHCEVTEARRSKGASVAHAVSQDPPGEEGRVFVVPRGSQDFAVVVRLRESEAERDRAHAPDAGPLRQVLPRAKFAVDRRRSVGPIEGMTRGFQVARGERVLVAPCDAPLLRPDLYRLLIKSLGAHDAAVPQVGVFDPIRAVYRRREVRRRLANTTESLPSPSSLVDRLDAIFVREDSLRSVDPRLDSFLDVNRQEH